MVVRQKAPFSEKFKLLALAIIELSLSQGISQAVRKENSTEQLTIESVSGHFWASNQYCQGIMKVVLRCDTCI